MAIKKYTGGKYDIQNRYNTASFERKTPIENAWLFLILGIVFSIQMDFTSIIQLVWKNNYNHMMTEAIIWFVVCFAVLRTIAALIVGVSVHRKIRRGVDNAYRRYIQCGLQTDGAAIVGVCITDHECINTMMSRGKLITKASVRISNVRIPLKSIVSVHLKQTVNFGVSVVITSGQYSFMLVGLNEHTANDFYNWALTIGKVNNFAPQILG